MKANIIPKNNNRNSNKKTDTVMNSKLNTSKSFNSQLSQSSKKVIINSHNISEDGSQEIGRHIYSRASGSKDALLNKSYSNKCKDRQKNSRLKITEILWKDDVKYINTSSSPKNVNEIKSLSKQSKLNISYHDVKNTSTMDKCSKEKNISNIPKNNERRKIQRSGALDSSSVDIVDLKTKLLNKKIVKKNLLGQKRSNFNSPPKMKNIRKVANRLHPDSKYQNSGLSSFQNDCSKMVNEKNSSGWGINDSNLSIQNDQYPNDTTYTDNYDDLWLDKDTKIIDFDNQNPALTTEIRYTERRNAFHGAKHLNRFCSQRSSENLKPIGSTFYWNNLIDNLAGVDDEGESSKPINQIKIDQKKQNQSGSPSWKWNNGRKNSNNFINKEKHWTTEKKKKYLLVPTGYKNPWNWAAVSDQPSNLVKSYNYCNENSECNLSINSKNNKKKSIPVLRKIGSKSTSKDMQKRRSKDKEWKPEDPIKMDRKDIQSQKDQIQNKHISIINEKCEKTENAEKNEKNEDHQSDFFVLAPHVVNVHFSELSKQAGENLHISLSRLTQLRDMKAYTYAISFQVLLRDYMQISSEDFGFNIKSEIISKKTEKNISVDSHNFFTGSQDLFIHDSIIKACFVYCLANWVSNIVAISSLFETIKRTIPKAKHSKYNFLEAELVKLIKQWNRDRKGLHSILEEILKKETDLELIETFSSQIKESLQMDCVKVKSSQNLAFVKSLIESTVISMISFFRISNGLVLFKNFDDKKSQGNPCSIVYMKDIGFSIQDRASIDKTGNLEENSSSEENIDLQYTTFPLVITELDGKLQLYLLFEDYGVPTPDMWENNNESTIYRGLQADTGSQKIDDDVLNKKVEIYMGRKIDQLQKYMSNHNNKHYAKINPASTKDSSIRVSNKYSSINEGNPEYMFEGSCYSNSQIPQESNTNEQFNIEDCSLNYIQLEQKVSNNDNNSTDVFKIDHQPLSYKQENDNWISSEDNKVPKLNQNHNDCEEMARNEYIYDNQNTESIEIKQGINANSMDTLNELRESSPPSKSQSYHNNYKYSLLTEGNSVNNDNIVLNWYRVSPHYEVHQDENVAKCPQSNNDSVLSNRQIARKANRTSVNGLKSESYLTSRFGKQNHSNYRNFLNRSPNKETLTRNKPNQRGRISIQELNNHQETSNNNKAQKKNNWSLGNVNRSDNNYKRRIINAHQNQQNCSNKILKESKNNSYLLDSIKEAGCEPEISQYVNNIIKSYNPNFAADSDSSTPPQRISEPNNAIFWREDHPSLNFNIHDHNDSKQSDSSVIRIVGRSQERQKQFQKSQYEKRLVNGNDDLKKPNELTPLERSKTYHLYNNYLTPAAILNTNTNINNSNISLLGKSWNSEANLAENQQFRRKSSNVENQAQTEVMYTQDRTENQVIRIKTVQSIQMNQYAESQKVAKNYTSVQQSYGKEKLNASSDDGGITGSYISRLSHQSISKHAKIAGEKNTVANYSSYNVKHHKFGLNNKEGGLENSNSLGWEASDTRNSRDLDSQWGQAYKHCDVDIKLYQKGSSNWKQKGGSEKSKDSRLIKIKSSNQYETQCTTLGNQQVLEEENETFDENLSEQRGSIDRNTGRKVSSIQTKDPSVSGQKRRHLSWVEALLKTLEKRDHLSDNGSKLLQNIRVMNNADVKSDVSLNNDRSKLDRHTESDAGKIVVNHRTEMLVQQRISSTSNGKISIRGVSNSSQHLVRPLEIISLSQPYSHNNSQFEQDSEVKDGVVFFRLSSKRSKQSEEDCYSSAEKNNSRVNNKTRIHKDSDNPQMMDALHRIDFLQNRISSDQKKHNIIMNNYYTGRGKEDQFDTPIKENLQHFQNATKADKHDNRTGNIAMNRNQTNIQEIPVMMNLNNYYHDGTQFMNNYITNGRGHNLYQHQPYLHKVPELQVHQVPQLYHTNNLKDNRSISPFSRVLQNITPEIQNQNLKAPNPVNPNWGNIHPRVNPAQAEYNRANTYANGYIQAQNTQGKMIQNPSGKWITRQLCPSQNQAQKSCETSITKANESKSWSINRNGNSNKRCPKWLEEDLCNLLKEMNFNNDKAFSILKLRM